MKNIEIFYVKMSHVKYLQLIIESIEVLIDNTDITFKVRIDKSNISFIVSTCIFKKDNVITYSFYMYRCDSENINKLGIVFFRDCNISSRLLKSRIFGIDNTIKTYFDINKFKNNSPSFWTYLE